LFSYRDMREQNPDRQTDRDTYRHTDRQTELKYYIDILFIPTIPGQNHPPLLKC